MSAVAHSVGEDLREWKSRPSVGSVASSEPAERLVLSEMASLRRAVRLPWPKLSKAVDSELLSGSKLTQGRSLTTWSRMASSRQFMEPYKLTSLQRAFLVPYFGIKAIVDPARGDYVAGFGDVLMSKRSLRELKTKMKQTSEGARILKEKPLITEESLDMEKLRNLPEDTLGYNYAKFMEGHGFNADERSKVKYMMDPDLAYVMARYRQVHDFWHVLCEVPISVLGEIGLKWFEWRAMGMLVPSAALSGLIGPLRLNLQERRQLRDVYFPWAMAAGGSCRELLGYDYVANMDKTLEEVRIDLGIVPFRSENK